jgi:streptogrisin C
MHRKLPALAVTALAVGAIGLGGQSAYADESEPPGGPGTTSPAPEIAPGMLKAVSRDLGITPDQARQRMENEQHAVALEQRLRKDLGRNYSGSWVAGDTSRLVVATTDRDDAEMIRDAGARPKIVEHSLAELERAKNNLDDSAKRLKSQMEKGPSVWGIDVRRNRVNVQAPEPATARQFVTRTGISSSLVRVTKATASPRTYYSVRGGDAYYINGTSRCSVGFSVTKGTRPGYVTAGHCGRTGARTQGHNRAGQGTFQNSSFPGNDFAWVGMGGNWQPTPYVKGPGFQNVPVRGSTESSVGASVCRSGSTSGWHCGSIQQRNVTVRYQQGTVYGLTRTNVCAEPGDSGGPFISGTQAQGMTSGGSGDCASGGTTFFQPVNEALSANGLKLRTTR